MADKLALLCIIICACLAGSFEKTEGKARGYVAQGIEQPPSKRSVVGSNPTVPVSKFEKLRRKAT